MTASVADGHHSHTLFFCIGCFHQNIVLGTTSVDLYVDFLCKNNHADVQILKDIKEIIPARNSVLHHATVVSHGFMLCGK